MSTRTSKPAVEMDGFRFAMIPEAMIYSDLSGTAIKVFGALLRHGSDPSRCYPSHKRLAALCHLSVPTVKRSIGELETAGWLSIVRRKSSTGGQTSNGYRLHDTPRGVKESLPPQVTSDLPPQVIDELPPRSSVSYEREQLNESNLNETPTPTVHQRRAPRKPVMGEAEARQRGWTDQQIRAAEAYVANADGVYNPKAYLQQILRTDPKSQPFIADLRRPMAPLFEASDTVADFEANVEHIKAIRQSLIPVVSH